MDEPVEPVLHNKLPLAVVDKIEIPAQVLSTVTTGVAGTDDGVLITAIVIVDIHPAAFFTVTL
jgi:hypothetical protein